MHLGCLHALLRPRISCFGNCLSCSNNMTERYDDKKAFCRFVPALLLFAAVQFGERTEKHQVETHTKHNKHAWVFLRQKGNRNEPEGNRLRPLPARKAQAPSRDPAIKARAHSRGGCNHASRVLGTRIGACRDLLVGTRFKTGRNLRDALERQCWGHGLLPIAADKVIDRGSAFLRDICCAAFYGCHGRFGNWVT